MRLASVDLPLSCSPRTMTVTGLKLAIALLQIDRFDVIDAIERDEVRLVPRLDREHTIFGADALGVVDLQHVVRLDVAALVFQPEISLEHFHGCHGRLLRVVVYCRATP